MIDVTCAIIRNEEDKILVVQRGENTDHPYKWEFPGGKIQTGETEEDCVIREIKEELSVNIVIFRRQPDVQHEYVNKKIRLIPFVCDTLDDLPFLTEHISYKWINPDDLLSVDFSEADIPVARQYLNDFTGKSSKSAKDEMVNIRETFNDAEFQAMIDRMVSLKQVDWIAASAVENPQIFRKLLEYSYSNDQKLAFHSSWILSKVHDKKPELLVPYLDQVIDSLEKINNESTLRSFLRILSLSSMENINRRQHGFLADYCFTYLNSTISAIAIKVYSMEILYKLSQAYPDLEPELAASINKVIELKSAGLVSRGRAILKKLDR